MSLSVSDSVNFKGLSQCERAYLLMLRLHIFLPSDSYKTHSITYANSGCQKCQVIRMSPHQSVNRLCQLHLQNISRIGTIFLHPPQLPPCAKTPSSFTQTVTIASSFFSFYSFCPPLVLFVPNAAISMTLLNHTAEHVSSARNPSVVFILEALAVTSTCLIISSWSSPPTFPLVHCSSHTGFFAPP